MKYPMLNNWLEFKQINKYEYEVYDFVEECRYIIDSEIVRFAKKLDGRTDPYSIYQSLPRCEVDDILEKLDSCDLIRRSRVCVCYLGNLVYTLYIPECNKAFKAISHLVNKLLIMLWFPMLIAGIVIMLNTEFESPNWLSTDCMLCGMILGTLTGMVLHELAHACACVCCGGKFYEAGVLVRCFVIFGAYVMINTDNIKDTMKRVQVNAAGIEMNMLLVGAFSIMSLIIPTMSCAFFVAAGANLLLVFINMLLIDGVDGMAIFTEVLGLPDFYEAAVDIVMNKNRKRKLLRKGLTGCGIVAASYLIVLLQLAMPILFVANFGEIILCFV